MIGKPDIFSKIREQLEIAFRPESPALRRGLFRTTVICHRWTTVTLSPAYKLQPIEDEQPGLPD